MAEEGRSGARGGVRPVRRPGWHPAGRTLEAHAARPDKTGDGALLTANAPAIVPDTLGSVSDRPNASAALPSPTSAAATTAPR